MILYHGSSIDIKEKLLRAHRPFNDDSFEKGVYLTSDYVVALLYGIHPVRSYAENQGKKQNFSIPAFTAHIRFNQKPYLVWEMYENMFNELYSKRTFIYECEVDEKLCAINKFEYFIHSDVCIKRKIIIPNMLSELRKAESEGNIILSNFNDLDERTKGFLKGFISSKAKHIETTIEADFLYDNFSNCDEVINNIPEKFREIQLCYIKEE